MLLLGFVLLCFLFFPAVVYTNYKNNASVKQPLQNLSVLIGGVTLMLGILFKVQHWPGASVLMLLGWVLILFVFMPILIIGKLKSDASKSEKQIYILGSIALIIFELSAMFKMFHWPGAFPLMLLGAGWLPPSRR